MKWLLMTLGTLSILVLVWFLFLAHQSKNAPKLGLKNGVLVPCVMTSNCVNSMAASGVEPIPFQGDPNQAWANMRKTVEALGGTIEQHTDNYLWATFSSPLFGFVDDVELLIVPGEQRFQVRSASRVGRSDFTANRDRVEAIRTHFTSMLP